MAAPLTGLTQALGAIKMFSDGQVNHVQCEECGESFPVYIFVADTDMPILGWVALTGTTDKDIVLAQLSSTESEAALAKLIGPNYKHVKVSFQEQAAGPTIGNFQDFLKTYKPAKATYGCIYCGGHAFETRTESQQDFMVHGKIGVRSGT